MCSSKELQSGEGKELESKARDRSLKQDDKVKIHLLSMQSWQVCCVQCKGNSITHSSSLVKKKSGKHYYHWCYFKKKDLWKNPFEGSETMWKRNNMCKRLNIKEIENTGALWTWKQALRVNVSPPRIPIFIRQDSKFLLNALDEVGTILFKS